MIYRFNEWTFQPENGRLQHKTKQAELRPKTAQILQILMDHSNQLVGKEHLMAEVWPDSHVSSGNLVQSIQEIRRALGDDAKNPTFVKTLPRRGYQWLVPAQKEAITPAPTPAKPPRATPLAPQPSTQQHNQARARFPLVKFLLPALIAVLAMATWFSWPRQNPQPSDPTAQEPLRLAMLPIVDETGLPSLDWMGPGIYELTSERLTATPHTMLLSKVQLSDTLSKQGIGNEHLDDPKAQQLLQSVDGHMLLQSSIQRHGTQFRYRYQLTKVNQGSATGSFTFTNPLDITNQIVKLLSVHPSPPQKGPQYSTIEAANKDFFRGKQALETQGAALAKRYFEAALLQDPQFDTCRLALALTLYLMGELPESKRLYEQVLATSLADEAIYHQIISLQGVGRIEWRLGQMTLSNQHIEQALSLARNSGYQRLEARSLRLLAWHAIHMGEWRKHDRYEQRAQEISITYGDEKAAADELYHMGSSESPHHNHEQGRLLLLMARDYYEKTGALADLAYTYSALGRNRANSPQQQEHYLQQALSLFEKLDYQLMIPGIWEALALCYAQYAEPAKFKEVILKAHDIYAAKGYVGDLANTQFLLAIVELMQGTFQKDLPLEPYLLKAEEWLNQCHDFHVEQQIRSRLGSGNLIRGMIAMERKGYARAKQLFESALEIYESLAFPEGIAVCAIAQASLALEQQNWKQAIQWATYAGKVYPERPGLWKPFVIHAYLGDKQQETALQMAQAWIDEARPKTKQAAEALYHYCAQINAGKAAAKPPIPNVIFTYFQSY